MYFPKIQHVQHENISINLIFEQNQSQLKDQYLGLIFFDIFKSI